MPRGAACRCLRPRKIHCHPTFSGATAPKACSTFSVSVSTFANVCVPYALFPSTILPHESFLSGSSHHGLGPVVRNRSAPTRCFNSGGTAKVSRECQRQYCCGRSASVFGQRVVKLIGGRRSIVKGSLRLRRMDCLFVKLRQSNQVLRVKCAERGRNRRPDPYNAFFHVWAKQCNPKIAANEEFGAAHGRRASRMGCAITLHFFIGRCRMVHDVPPIRSLTISAHRRLQRASG